MKKREQEIESRRASLWALWDRDRREIGTFINGLAESFQMHVEQHRADREIIHGFIQAQRRGSKP